MTDFFLFIKTTIDDIATTKNTGLKYEMLTKLKDELNTYRTKFELFDALEHDEEDARIISKWMINCAKLLLHTDWSPYYIGNQESIYLVEKYIDFSRKFAFISMPINKAYRVFRPEVIDKWAEEGWV